VGERANGRTRVTDPEDRDTAIAEFDRCRQDFEQAVRRAPDAALRFRPAGEDYALGGLVVHVTDVLTHYAAVLEAIHTADWQQPRAPDHQTPAAEAELIRAGFDGAERSGILDRMRAAHKALVEAVGAEPADWFRRQAPVTYSDGSEPYATSPADVLGWVRDHYEEHTRQVVELVSNWAVATR
jgi:hypothetical protein